MVFRFKCYNLPFFGWWDGNVDKIILSFDFFSFNLIYTRWLPGFARVPYYAPSPCHMPMYTPMPKLPSHKIMSST